jgi:hypothetical protein
MQLYMLYLNGAAVLQHLWRRPRFDRSRVGFILFSRFLELYTALHITVVQYFLLDSFALAAASGRHDQYFCTLLLPSYMRLHALNCPVKEGDGWTAFRSVPGDTAITRGDQIRKRNVYCRRRTRLSSFSEIIHPERRKGREKEGSFVWHSENIFPWAVDRKYICLSYRIK